MPPTQTEPDDLAHTGRLRQPGEGIDASRYGEPSSPDNSADATSWRAPLKTAYAAQTYLAGRAETLAALEAHGKNAWLVANFQAENELRAYEQLLKEARVQTQEADDQSRRAQQAGTAELDALEDSWRKGLGRAIEAELATEALRSEALEARRLLAQR